MTTLVPSFKIPRNVSECKVKPKFWDDDLKMESWFAPFRNRDLNPLNYDNKITFWKSGVNYFCTQVKQCYFNLNDLKRFFVRNEKVPSCLAAVLEDMIREGVVQSLSDFERNVPNNTWVSWAVNKLIGSPFKWSLKKVADIVSPPAVEIEDDVEYVYIPALKEQAENLYKTVNGAKDIFTYDTLKELHCKTLDTRVDLKMIKLLVQWLEMDGKAQVYFESKHCHVHLIKFKSDSYTAPQISEAEVSIYILQRKEQSLIDELRTFEAEKEKLHIEVKNHLKQKKKNTARNTLRKQKEMEKRITKLTNVLENIQSLLYRVQDTEVDSQILESYKVGADALKSRMCKTGLNLVSVDHTMDEIEKALDLHTDIQEALGQAVITLNENDLESELAELLLDDLPPVPPELGSPGRKPGKNNADLNDLPEVPSVLSKLVRPVEKSEEKT